MGEAVEATRPIVLGIETSCDETAAAVVAGDGRILGETLLSQLDEHRPYGGVVPEIAARAHLDHLDGLIARAMDEAGLGFEALDGVAATAGPGLIGGVMVGVTMAKAIAAVHGLAFVAVNHLEGHALTARMVGDAAFPYLLLLVSGGHCQLVVVEDVERYRRLGSTVDDAVGEAFDKTAKLLGLGYPGGPAVEAAARTGDPSRVRLPRPMKGRDNCDFSFAGLKTAVRQAVETGAGSAADIAAAFQAAVTEVLVDRTTRAMDRFAADRPEAAPVLVVAGGVAANAAIRAALTALAEERGWRLVAPPLRLCTDNAAMIAWAGVEHLRLGLTDTLDFRPRPRWPLEGPRVQPRNLATTK